MADSDRPDNDDVNADASEDEETVPMDLSEAAESDAERASAQDSDAEPSVQGAPNPVPGLPPSAGSTKGRGSDGEDAKKTPFRKGGVTAGFEAASALFAKRKKAHTDITDDQERWLLRISGMDYGPYDAPTVREKLEAEEINEYTVITDSQTGELSDLIDAQYFEDYVIDFIPRRNQRQIEAQERREELVNEVKKRSVRASMMVAVGAVVLAALGLVVLDVTNILPFRDVIETVHPSPREFPFDQVVRDYRFHFDVPEPTYESIDANEKLVASLFKKPSAGSGRHHGGGGSRHDRFDTDGQEAYTVSFDSSMPTGKLTSAQVNTTISKYSSRIGSCFQKELERNSNFKGATLKFSIAPSGKTFSVRASTKGGHLSSTAEGCLVRAVRSMHFPQFNDIPMSISYPFYVQ